MKNRGKIITVLGIVLAAGGAVARTLLNAKKSDIVIYNGISTFRSYMNTVQAVCIAGFAITLLGVILTIASGSTKRAEKKQKEKVETSRKQKKKSYSPEDIRESISEFRGKYPDFPLGRCVAQLDQMDNYQARLRELLDSNDLDAFSYTEDILKDVEMELCRDIKSFTNYMIVSDDPKVTMSRYNDMLARNEKRFGYVQSLLLTLADFVNENIKSEDALEKIKYCNEAIRDTFVLFD